MTKEEYLNSDFVKMAHLNNQVAYLTQKNRKLNKENKQLKADIIEMEKVSDYRFEENERLKETIENARKKLFDILADYEIGNYDNNTHQFYKDVYDIHNELIEVTK